VAKEVCEILGFDRAVDAIKYLDADEQTVIKDHTLTNRRNPNVSIINEPGLYSLILRSRKPEAKKFKRWITHEVIPTIRKTGSYSTANQPPTLPSYPEALRQLADSLEREKTLKLEKSQQKPKVDAFDRISNSDGYSNITTAAKTLQMRPKDLFSLLSANDGFTAGRAASHGLDIRTRYRPDILPTRSPRFQPATARRKPSNRSW
jgi:prophage antirepressor-like protein